MSFFNGTTNTYTTMASALLGASVLFGAVGCDDASDAREPIDTTRRITYEKRVVTAPPSDDTLVSGTSVEGPMDETMGEEGVALDEMKDGLERDVEPMRYRVMQRQVPAENMSQEQMDRLVSRALETREGRSMIAPLFFDGSSPEVQTTSMNDSGGAQPSTSNTSMQPSAGNNAARPAMNTGTVNNYGAQNAYPTPTSYQLDPEAALDNPDVLISPTYDGTVSPNAGDNAGTFRSPVSRRPLSYETTVNPYTTANQNTQLNNVGTTFQTNATLNSLGQGSVAVPQTPPSSALPSQTTGQIGTQGTRVNANQTGQTGSATTNVNANQTTGSVSQVPSRSSLPSRTVGNGALGGPAVGPATGGAGTAGY